MQVDKQNYEIFPDILQEYFIILWVRMESLVNYLLVYSHSKGQ